MNRREAKELISRELEKYRNKPYSELVEMVKKDITMYDCITTPKGVKYDFQIYALWDDKPNGNVRVFGIIYDGRFWSFTFPTCNDFIKSPTGKFIGESKK